MRLPSSVLLLSLPAVLAAQAPRPALESRLDPATLARVQPIIEAARADSLPVGALTDKALEGAAKRVAPERIEAALRQLCAALGTARSRLRAGAPSSPPTDGELLAAANAIQGGVPPGEVELLRRHVAAETSLILPLTLLSDLARRGVPAGDARAVIEQLVQARLPPTQFAEIPARMDVALQRHAAPTDALMSALPGGFGRPLVPKAPGAPPAPALSPPQAPSPSP